MTNFIVPTLKYRDNFIVVFGLFFSSLFESVFYLNKLNDCLLQRNLLNNKIIYLRGLERVYHNNTRYIGIHVMLSSSRRRAPLTAPLPAEPTRW